MNQGAKGSRVQGFKGVSCLAIAAGLLTQGCVRHIYPYSAKVREYEPMDYAAPDAEQTRGSLWSEGAPGLFEDARARRVGDILTVKIDERSDASRDASTSTSRQTDISIGVSAFFSAMQSLAAKNPDLDPSALIQAATQNDFEGQGATKRSGTVSATLPVRIKKNLPNGDFYIEGNKVLLLNEEETTLYVSGVVRPVDIDPDNAVSSAMLADVELEFTGRGVISEKQQPGVVARVLDYLWPF